MRVKNLEVIRKNRIVRIATRTSLLAQGFSGRMFFIPTNCREK